ncbi:unnamed protein product [Pseudo-nitzschia multistriata]|uniref:Polysaccharide biosynthesis protein C-terminal domain-containing protein n=1 Tax=Pseudo-nitzschia multistriata TaxID=183589 RepID=A0A448ZMG2_9STRA|nr:unnamed protein product [Pseudo-nitzschia multistriata]
MAAQHTRAATLGIAVLVSATATNAFVPMRTHSGMARVSGIRQRRPQVSPREYSSSSDTEDRSKKESSSGNSSSPPPPEPIDPVFSSLFDETINFLGETSGASSEATVPSTSEGNEPPQLSIGFDPGSPPRASEVSDPDARAIFAENAAILAAGKEGGIDIDTNMNMSIDIDMNLDLGDAPGGEGLVSEDLEAVLAASGEAAAAAEARMPPELREVLDELAIEALNPTEVVPTVAAAPTLPLQTQAARRQAEGEELASQQAGETAVQNPPAPIPTPGVGKILRFAVPAIGVWLCSPLLSLIDTSAVGVLSGTVQQAALGPAVAVTDYAALLIVSIAVRRSIDRSIGISVCLSSLGSSPSNESRLSNAACLVVCQQQAFLYTGTTNMVASAQESDRGTTDKPRTAEMMMGAMRMSTYVGIGLGSLLFAFARPLLRAIIGNDAIGPAVFASAMRYVRIRALGMPAAAILGSTQAACLGMQDVRSPLYVLAAAAVVNLFGDALFVGHSHPLIGGTAGAAWATVLSQYAAVALFVRWLCGRAPEEREADVDSGPEVMNLSSAILEITNPGERDSNSNARGGHRTDRRQRFRAALESFKLAARRKKTPVPGRSEARRSPLRRLLPGRTAEKTSSGSGNESGLSFSTRGFLRNRFSAADLLRPPGAETRREFAPYVVPVTTTQVGRVSGYIAMAHVVASSLGTVGMAAQQVVVSIFYCLCPIADSLSLTAQSFVPAVSERPDGPEKASAMGTVLANFLKAGLVFGAAMVAAVGAIPLLAGWFTSDPSVVALVRSVVPLLLVFFGVHGLVCGSEGVLLGRKDLGFLGKMYAAFFVAVPYFMMGVKRRALAGAAGLSSVWTVFVGYQLARCGIWVARACALQARTRRSAAATAVRPFASEPESNKLAP